MTSAPHLAEREPHTPGEEAPVDPGRSGARTLTALLLAAVVVVSAVVWQVSRPERLLTEEFDGPDRTFVSQDEFWDSDDDLGIAENPDWFSESGELVVRDGQGHTDDPAFRMWTRDQSFAYPTVDLDMTFHGYAGGRADWRGLSLWLNRSVCTPVPDCSAVDDSDGNSGYMLRFVAADGSAVINKKIAGDTRDELPEGAVSYVQGGTYYLMAKADWVPEEGRTYHLTGRVSETDDGTLIEMLVDGEPLLQVVDDGSTGGPPLAAERVGLRTDYADVDVDNITITR